MSLNWYVVHAYSNFEHKVASSLKERIRLHGLDEKFGEVRVADERGNEIMVHARLGAGEPPLTRGARVVLVDYDSNLDLFWATASPADVQAST